MKNLTFVFVLLSSSIASAALLAQPINVRNSRAQLEVLPPMGFLGCEECEKQFMGGIKGPSSVQLQNIRYHMAEIYGSGRAAGSKSNSIREN